MTYVWARWLAEALRARPALRDRVVEVSGWETRGRPPSQFSFLPTGVVGHHTACGMQLGHDPQWCLNVLIDGRWDCPGPISQLLGTFTPPGVRWDGRNVDPRIVVVAAGRANHAGTGVYPWGAPSGNGSSIGVEWCGPPDGMWPDQVIEFRAEVESALLAWNGWGAHQFTTHHEYAPTRKIDPSGPHRYEPGIDRRTPWSASLWRSVLAQRLTPPPPPPPPPPPLPPVIGDDMEPFDVTAPRVLDTRQAAKPHAGSTLVVAPHPQYPAGVTKVLANVTIVESAGAGFITVWPSGTRPNASTQNTWGPGQTIAGLTMVRLDSNRRFRVYTSMSAHILVDIVAVG